MKRRAWRGKLASAVALLDNLIRFAFGPPFPTPRERPNPSSVMGRTRSHLSRCRGCFPDRPRRLGKAPLYVSQNTKRLGLFLTQSSCCFPLFAGLRRLAMFGRALFARARARGGPHHAASAFTERRASEGARERERGVRHSPGVGALAGADGDPCEALWGELRECLLGGSIPGSVGSGPAC